MTRPSLSSLLLSCILLGVSLSNVVGESTMVAPSARSPPEEVSTAAEDYHVVESTPPMSSMQGKIQSASRVLKRVVEINQRLESSSRVVPSYAHDSAWLEETRSHPNVISQASLEPRRIPFALERVVQRSIFHEEPSQGVDGLEDYLASLVRKLHVSEMELILALLYLDRSISVDTPRTSLPCPFVTPSTLRRLVCTSVLVALESCRGSVDLSPLEEKREKLLERMVWMKQALGDQGRIVTPQQMDVWDRCLQ